MPLLAFRSTKIDASEEKSEFFLAQLVHAIADSRPGELSLFQSLCQNPVPRTIPHNQFHEVPSTIAEPEDMS